MTDLRLRTLERARDGDPHQHARLLRARERAGELDPRRLAAAAYLGDPAARLVLGDRAPDLPTDDGEWIRAMAPWGKALCVRVAVAVARAAAANAKPQPWPASWLAILSAEIWIAEPSPQNTKDANHAAGRAIASSHTPAVMAAFAAASAAGARADAASAAWVAWYAERAATYARAGLPRGRVREVVAEDLGPWVLETGDPLIARLASSPNPAEFSVDRLPMDAPLRAFVRDVLRKRVGLSSLRHRSPA